TTLFASPGTDRNIDGHADTGTLTIELLSGQELTLENFAGITLQNAQVEGIVAGKEWKIINGDGKQYFIQTAADVNGNPILIVSGEQRTFQLAPQSFEVKAVGALTLYAPSTLNNAHPSQWLHLDGGFLLRITASQTTFFFTAGGEITPLGISGRATGLLILQYQAQTPQGIPGIAGSFDLEIGAGIPPGGTSSAAGGLSPIPRIFSLRGSVRVA